MIHGSTMAEQRRKCFKCDCSFAQDNVKLFRFPKPSKRNLVRCEHWAQYIFPEREYRSIALQTKLHNAHRMLCQKHFRDEDFTDPSKKKLLRTAVPSDTIAELLISVEPQPGPSHRVPLCDIKNAQEPSGTIPEAEAVGKIGKEKALRAKCTKYVKKCQFKNRIKTLKSKAILTAIEEDKYVQKLSPQI